MEEGLDLCLACKGCKSDCPVNVDMATYKAEFRARHYAGRLRPRAAYSMGHIYWWSRLGSAMPTLANFVSHTPGISSAAKWAGGISTARQMPPFAGETFIRWFRRNRQGGGQGEKVVLWPEALLPAVRAAAPETLILADGFSCREQIRQETGREARHVAEVTAEAIARRG